MNSPYHSKNKIVYMIIIFRAIASVLILKFLLRTDLTRLCLEEGLPYDIVGAQKMQSSWADFKHYRNAL